MKKPKLKFLNGFKDKFNKIFRRNKKIDIENLDIEYGSFDEEYEDEYEDDEEDFVAQELTVKNVKANSESEQPPSLDSIDHDEEYDYDEDDDEDYEQLEGTGHSYKEFQLPEGKFSISSKLRDKKQQIQSALTKKIKNAKNNRDWKESFKKIQGHLQSLEWEKWLKGFYSANNRALHHKAFLVTLIAVGSYQIGSMVAQSLIPKTKSVSKAVTSSSRSGNTMLSKQMILLELLLL